MRIFKRDEGLVGKRAELARWTAPAVKRLNAGAAENASGPTPDDQVNYS